MNIAVDDPRLTALIKSGMLSSGTETLRALRRILPRSHAVCVITPASAGALGDQAMLEVMRRILGDRFGFAIRLLYQPGAEATVLKADCPQIVLSHSRRRYARLAHLALTSSHVVFLGADTLDGTYNSPKVKTWLGFLARARRVGARAAVVNFSFSENPDAGVCERLRAITDVQFWARDEVSLARFARATGQSAALGADVAFLLDPDIISANARRAADWVAKQRRDDRIVLGVNASGHTLASMSGAGIAAHVEALRHWLAADPRRVVLVIPHDFRAAPVGDVEPAEAIAGALRDAFPDRVEMLRPPFAAWDVKGLCGHLDGVLSGRMHLSIAALGMGTPALSVAYGGKFEGTMRHFGLENLLIAPETFPERCRTQAILEAFTADLPGLRARILRRLPDVRALAERQFDWFGKSGPPSSQR